LLVLGAAALSAAGCDTILGIGDHDLAPDASPPPDASLDGTPNPAADANAEANLEATAAHDARATDATVDGPLDAPANDAAVDVVAADGPSSEAAAFSPSDLTGLGLWLRSDVGVTLNGATVSKWADQSGQGNDFTQATAPNQPTLVPQALNGMPVVQFDGANSFLGGKIAGGLAYRTVCLVLEDGGSNAANHDGVAAVLGAAGAAGVYVDTTTYHVAVDGSGANATTTAVSSTRATSGYHAYCVTYASATTTSNSSVYVDGLPQATFAGTPAAIVTSPSTVAYDLGARNDGFDTRRWKGDLAELVAYDRVLTGPEIAQVSAYLMQRQGLITPLSLPGCDLWFRPDYGLSVDGGVASHWVDQAQGLVLAAKATPNYPGYSETAGPRSTPVLTFDGTRSLGIATAPTSIFADSTRGTTAASVFLFSGLQISYGDYSGSVPVHLTQNSTRTQRLAGSTIGDTNTATPLTGTVAEAWVTTSTNGVQVFRVNGSAQSLSAGGTGTGTFTPDPALGFWFGAAANGPHPLTGQLAEFIVYNRVLSPAEIVQLESYLRTRYALW
jgi:hypothetical protein